jgi:predicted dehydrogenase
MNKPSFALIGIGGFGREHFNILRRLERQGRLVLCAVCDPCIFRDSGLLEEVRAGGIRAYRDYREMLSSEPGLSVVTIVTPICLHEEMVIDCLDCGLDVYLEKPPVPLIGQLERLIAADHAERVSVGFQMVDSAWSQRLKGWICEGRFGEVEEIRVTASWPRYGAYYRRAPWAGRMMLRGEPVFDGPATNALSHLIHNAMYLGGESHEEFAKPVSVRGEVYRVRPIESYDVACLRGGLSSGVDFFAALSHAEETMVPFRIEVRGSKGWCCVSEETQRVESSWGPFSMNANATGMLSEAYEGFVGFTCGERPRVTTSLKDTRGYVLATNAMLLSSGGIHEIGSKSSTPCERDGDWTYRIDGLASAIAGDESLLFSERGFPWAVVTPEIAVESSEDWADKVDGFFSQSDDTSRERRSSLA